MTHIQDIHQSGEDYLECILLLDNRTGFVRAVDIAAELGYSKPSVSNALRILRDRGYADVTDGRVTLTELGTETAKQVYERHSVLRRLFADILGVSKDVAERDACAVEHVISEESFTKLKLFLAMYNPDNSANYWS
ncbi:MAG: metal-dependent transcriptional regulator [Oscillospiraceae bacterium]|jgi:Mn-dependent DtxR family transcriptional regulator|nr:metal-dependent transcriptional regulator [Oscillospiraceae bacterium]